MECIKFLNVLKYYFMTIIYNEDYAGTCRYVSRGVCLGARDAAAFYSTCPLYKHAVHICTYGLVIFNKPAFASISSIETYRIKHSLKTKCGCVDIKRL